MNIVYLILDILIYLCGAGALCVGAFMVMRYFKGEARKRAKRSKENRE